MMERLLLNLKMYKNKKYLCSHFIFRVNIMSVCTKKYVLYAHTRSSTIPSVIVGSGPSRLRNRTQRNAGRFAVVHHPSFFSLSFFLLGVTKMHVAPDVSDWAEITLIALIGQK